MVLHMPAINHKLLRKRRDELDLSNGELAGLAEVNYKYLSNILSGGDEPSMRIIHRLSRALDLSVEAILAKPQGDPSEPPTQPSRPAGTPKRQATERTTRPRRVGAVA